MVVVSDENIQRFFASSPRSPRLRGENPSSSAPKEILTTCKKALTPNFLGFTFVHRKGGTSAMAKKAKKASKKTSKKTTKKKK